MDEVTDKQLARIRELLNQTDKPPLERLAHAACALATAIIDHELATRGKMRIKNQPR